MGQTGTKVASKIASSFSFSGSATTEDEVINGEKTLARFGGTPLVYSRRGSMYFDEDGELAHEFYEEVMPKRGHGRRKMKKVSSKNLMPQGEVPYIHPRLHVDFPIILYQG